VANALVGDTLRCSIPISSITPEQIFSKMEAARQTVGVRDWGVANASLEDVFIQVARLSPLVPCSVRDACADCDPAPDRGRAQAYSEPAAGMSQCRAPRARHFHVHILRPALPSVKLLSVESSCTDQTVSKFHLLCLDSFVVQNSASHNKFLNAFESAAVACVCPY
jgi:hypothetical protein